MPKAKKTKIKPVAGTPTADIVAVYADAVEEAAAEEMEVEQEVERHAKVKDSIKDEEKEVLAEVNEVIKLARAEIAASQVRVREAETALRAEQRRAEERDKRWWAAELREDKENRPPPYLQVERVYKGQIKDLRARLALSEAQRKAAEAESELRWLLLGREEWEHSRTRCKLSGNV
tara:strand:+ start:282 stop:809 length:528 start_codon:yes stop_codon:yes gene_type:complete